MEKKKKVSTKQRIIDAAISLYNEYGAHNITSRHIAAELGISHGNLDYHYNNREAILIAIYKQMRDEMSGSLDLHKDNVSSFEYFHYLMLHVNRYQMKYRFFNLDVLEISRSYPEISKLLQETVALRKVQMEEVFNKFLESGFIANDLQSTFERLRHTMRIVMMFWLPQREVLASYNFLEKGEMVRHLWELLVPYMTYRGKQEYERLVEEVGFDPEELDID